MTLSARALPRNFAVDALAPIDILRVSVEETGAAFGQVLGHWLVELEWALAFIRVNPSRQDEKESEDES